MLQNDDHWQGFSILTGEAQNLLKSGVYDPYSVVSTALQSAVSGATMVLSCQEFIPEPVKPFDYHNLEGWDLK